MNLNLPGATTSYFSVKKSFIFDITGIIFPGDKI